MDDICSLGSIRISNINFGVASQIISNQSITHNNIAKNDYYSFSCGLSKSNKINWSPYSNQYGKGDQVVYTLNLQNRTFSIKNFVIFDDIKVGNDIKYRFVVQFGTKDGSVSLLNFSISS